MLTPPPVFLSVGIPTPAKMPASCGACGVSSFPADPPPGTGGARADGAGLPPPPPEDTGASNARPDAFDVREREDGLRRHQRIAWCVWLQSERRVEMDTSVSAALYHMLWFDPVF